MSLSLRMQERFQRRSTIRLVIAILYVLLSLVYLAWRTTTFNPSSLTLSYLFYAADLIGGILGLTAIYVSWNYRHRVPPPAPPGLSVDVFIPVYKESIEIIRQTVIAAKAIDYPHETWVLDDSHSEKIRLIADEFDCHYLAREDHRDNKAGNLNYGLKHSNAEFVAVFDADFVAMPHALHSLLGFFREENVSMVQAPQVYYNVKNAFSHFINKKTGTHWYDQSFFYQISEPGRDAHNSGTCVGTCVVYRRSALNEIGGIPGETVTEDLHTSLKLHKKGYETVFINEPVAYGVDAVDLAEFYKTRLRWAHGNIHVLRQENILFCKGLSLSQRLSYLALGLVYLEGWQQLILFLVPVISLFFGIPPFEISIINILIILLFPIVSYLLMQEMGCGFSRYWINELFSVARFPVYLVAWRALFNARMAWLFSSKNMKGKVNLALISPYLAVLLISATAIFYGIIRLASDFRTGPIVDAITVFFYGGVIPDIHLALGDGYALELVLVSGFFALFNGARAAIMIRKAFGDAKRSEKDYFFNVQLPAELTILGKAEIVPAIAEDISISKIRFKLKNILVPDLNQFSKAKLFLPSGPKTIKIRLPSDEEKIGFWDQDGTNIKSNSKIIPIQDKEVVLEAEILWDREETNDNFMQSLLSLDWQQEIQNRSTYFLTPLEYLEKLFRIKKRENGENQTWQPAVLRDKNNGKQLPVFISNNGIRHYERGQQGNQQILTFKDLGVGETIEILNSYDHKPAGYRIEGDLPIDSLGPKGLDGAIMRKYQAKLIK